MPRRDENNLPLVWMIFALLVAITAVVLVFMYFGIGAGLLTFVGFALLAGELEAMGLLSNDQD